MNCRVGVSSHVINAVLLQNMSKGNNNQETSRNKTSIGLALMGSYFDRSVSAAVHNSSVPIFSDLQTSGDRSGTRGIGRRILLANHSRFRSGKPLCFTMSTSDKRQSKSYETQDKKLVAFLNLSVDKKQILSNPRRSTLVLKKFAVSRLPLNRQNDFQPKEVSDPMNLELKN